MKTAYYIMFQLITNSKAFSVGATTEIGLNTVRYFSRG